MHKLRDLREQVSHQGYETYVNRFFFMLIFAILLFSACSFDYSAGAESEKKGKADIVMEKIEYVRVRRGDPLVRFQAEYAERWEDRQIMEFRDFSFEQLEDHGETINAEGSAGSAEVQIGSGDITLSGGVRINIESEDIIIRTAGLEWKDKEKLLSGGEQDNVDIQRSDGTSFSGRGFHADMRNRTWNFSGEVKGTYVEKEDGEAEGKREEPKAAPSVKDDRPLPVTKKPLPPAEDK